MQFRIGSLRISNEQTGQENAELQSKLNAIDKSQAVIEFNMDGTIISANENFLGAMGYSLNDIQGQHHSMFLSPQDAQSNDYRQFWQRLNNGEFQSGEFRRIANGGKEVWIQATYNPIFDANGTPIKVVKFASDITQEKLRTAEFESQIDAIGKSQAVIHFDLDGNIQWANDNFLGAMGYSLAEVQGKHHAIFVDSEYARSQDYLSFWAKLKRGEFHSGEFRRVNKAGEDVWIQASYNPIMDASGHPVKVVKFASDITAQKIKTADNDSQISAISKSQAVIHFNMDGTILWANDNFLNTVGYSLTDIKGQHHKMFVDATYGNSAEYKAFWEKLDRGEFDSGEFQRFGKGGKEIWIQASYNPILDVDGTPVKVVKFAADITEQKTQSADFSGQLEAISKSQAVIEFDLDGNIQNANENFLNAVGYSLDEIKGNHHRMFVDQQTANSVEYRQFWQNLKNGEFASGEYKRVGKHGKEIWIQASYNPILDTNGRPFKVVKYASDITATKMRNADFEGQLEAIGKAQAVIEFNLDGTIISANHNFLAAMEYSLEEIQGKHHRMFVEHDYAISGEYEAFWAKLNRGEYESGEFKRLTKSGDEIWIQASYNPILDMSGNPVKIVKYATDVTEDKMRNANFQGQIEAIHKSQAVIEFDLEGNILIANDNFLGAMGYRLEDIQGKHHSMFVESSYGASPEYQQFWSNLKQGHFQSGEYKRIHRNGQEVWISASYNPILDLNGKPYKVVKFATDITGRVKAVNTVAETLSTLAEGDLTCRIDEEFIPEFQTLKDSINQTIGKLRNIVSQINDAAMEVTTGSSEISQGNLDLSGRTEQQASSLQQTASSMEEMTSTVRETAANIREANKLSRIAREKAETGGQVVSSAVKSMEAISTASRKIADIIGVIDEIAFQTNLLALNAAVEAARAGEDGRGFAVVATEVRSLAQRSAGAAKEIKELIEDSVGKVDEGTRMVNESGETLNDIIGAVASVSEMIDKISDSSEEQASGITEINNAIAHMDGMTQQNAALVEEASAASGSLSNQANEMIDQLNFFKM
ncbi:MAG: PAS domain S-box protein [Alteromonadaceae bacterium]|nr:PAS domain S-box protein [Alteromonadaceae bacterium]